MSRFKKVKPPVGRQGASERMIYLLKASIARGKYYINPFMSYELPNPLQTDCQYEKFIGADIETMSELDVWKERKRLENLLAWTNDRDILFINPSGSLGRVITLQDWLLDRMAKLRRRHTL